MHRIGPSDEQFAYLHVTRLITSKLHDFFSLKERNNTFILKILPPKYSQSAAILLLFAHAQRGVILIPGTNWKVMEQ